MSQSSSRLWDQSQPPDSLHPGGHIQKNSVRSSSMSRSATDSDVETKEYGVPNTPAEEFWNDSCFDLKFTVLADGTIELTETVKARIAREARIETELMEQLKESVAAGHAKRRMLRAHLADREKRLVVATAKERQESDSPSWEIVSNKQKEDENTESSRSSSSSGSSYLYVSWGPLNSAGRYDRD
ncbi:hypothetical protein LTR56_007723 [Elasticomyces elasticus]|nr:hypothetical protein LTR56_007723 [Elasticomyces elasticus]KAK3661905.1 hypothetical protein LTR22_007279 [Elasticomyces elasticus]KAK4925582.1 hypothetical protein LTR49_007420 [Elasticomyces elasticus]KAK5759860.1 hypothetical protein LTS12_010047 [Elasticomyces elasticus]